MENSRNSIDKIGQLHFTIEEAVPEDGRSARFMQAKSWRATYPNEEAGVSRDWVWERTSQWLEPERLRQSVEIFANILADPKQFYRIAKSADQTIGFAHVSTKDDGNKHLEAIYTDPDTLGTGVGAALMESTLEWIGNSETSLEVVSYNERAIRFYEKYGFKVVPGSEHLYADTLPVVDMRREAV